MYYGISHILDTLKCNNIFMLLSVGLSLFIKYIKKRSSKSHEWWLFLRRV